MNRKKWQGLTCALLASLMMNSAFATSTRNAAPKPVQPPQQIQSQQPATPKPVTSPAPTQVAPKPVTSPSPVAPTPSAPTQVTPKPVAPSPSTAPKPMAPPKTEAPKCTAPQKETPKCTPSTTTKPSKAPQKEQAVPKKEQKKPFTLDHFKMIVCTLKQLGMEENEIATYIKQGKKLEDILDAEKISAKKFKKCILKQYCKAIDEGVKEGQLTKEQSKQLKVAIKETVKNWLPKNK